jgi:hypothetical protein
LQITTNYGLAVNARGQDPPKAEPENGSSPLAEALAKLGDRGRPLVVEVRPGGPQRFNDLPGQIPGIAANIRAPQAAEAGRAVDCPALLSFAACLAAAHVESDLGR